jgi:hypothetical protein
MGVQTFYSKGPHQLLWVGSRAASGNTTISDIPNRLNYCLIFIVHIHIIHKYGRGPRIGDLWVKR